MSPIHLLMDKEMENIVNTRYKNVLELTRLIWSYDEFPDLYDL